MPGRPSVAALGRYYARLARCQPPAGAWPASLLPSSGSAFVLIDGFASLSFRPAEIDFVPLIDLIEPMVREAGRDEAVCQMSYLAPNVHYGVAETNRRLLGREGQRLLQPYAPRAGIETSYATFSLGGTRSLLELSTILATDPRAMQHVKELILIQPALTPRATVVDEFNGQNDQGAATENVEGDPTRADVDDEPAEPSTEQAASIVFLPFREFANPAFGLATRLEAAIATLGTHLQLTMLYWPGDGLLDFTGWDDRVKAVGGKVLLVNDDVPTTKPAGLTRAFVEHTRVIREDATKAKLVQHLAPPINDGQT